MNHISVLLKVTIDADYKEADLKEKIVWAINEMCYRLDKEYFPIHDFIGYQILDVISKEIR